MATTSIEWTQGLDGVKGKVWNPVTGCTKVSQGCKNCYAETIAKRFWKDRRFTEVQFHPERLEQPLHWKKPSMIFVNSMSDLFHEDIPDNFIADIFGIMAIGKQHTFQVLTKRPDRMLKFVKKYYGNSDYIEPIYANYSHTAKIPIPNIWLGVSVENQEAANERIPLLLQTPAKIRWISAEPLLGKIDLTFPIGHWEDMKCDRIIGWNGKWKEDCIAINKLDWVVVGCESGPNRRECKIEWVESIVEQCKSAKVPVFVKQLSMGGAVIKDINQFPKHLQIREYPL